ncbi:hypothetical protein BJX76DRAFT_350476 [Aspergillus varians]
MRPATRNVFAVAIICTLPLEADAVEILFDETYDRLSRHYGKHPSDRNAYINRRISKHNVILCYMPGIGKGSAASIAASLRFSYAGIKLALVVGICGGVPSPPTHSDIFLGDIVISNAYENQILQHLHILQQTETRWHYPQVHDVLFKASYIHKYYGQIPVRCCCADGNLPDNICEDALKKNCDDLGCEESQVIRYQERSGVGKVSMHIGTVASADTVMKSAQHRDEIARKEKILAFEMEGAGVWDNISCIIIKGVCDYADSYKSKAWQAYAAATGASAAKAFLEYWTPVNHEDARKSRHLMIPFGRNPRFVGRQDEIHKLEDLIFMPDSAKKLAITGLGGVGKTQVALELAYRVRDRDPDYSIFWIPCTSSEAVEQACMSITQMVGIQDVKPGDWLLIFDNADEMEMWIKGSNNSLPLKDFLPFNNQGHIVFTTRNRKLAVKLASFDVIPVHELDEKTGVEFLERSLIQNSLINNYHAVITLLKQLTFLPLAITQAAAYINENGIAVSDYLLLLQEQETDVMELLSKDFGDNGRYKDIQNPVAKTWLISFSQVQKLDQLAAEYLSLMACVDPRNIPQTFLPQPGSKVKMTDALGLLSAYSFITIQPNCSITLHRLVYLATRNWMRKEEQFPAYIKKAADQLNKTFPTNKHTNRQLWREYLPHALSLLGEREFHEQQEHYIDYMQDVGICLCFDGRYSEAEELQVQVIQTQKQVLGPEHHDTLISIGNLASIYGLEIQVLKILKQVLGLKHPGTLISMGNLATIYGLLIQHPDILTSMGNLASIYGLGMQVLETHKQVLGLKHPDTLTIMDNLASTYRDQGRWKEAEHLEMQVMEIRKKVLGPEHPYTLTTMGRWKEAEELGIQVIETRKQKSLGNIQDALAMINKCIELCNKVLGLVYLDYMSSYNALANWETDSPSLRVHTQSPH